MNQERYVLYCDNQSVIHLAKNVTYHAQTKHTQRRYLWIHEVVEEKSVELEKVHTNQNGSFVNGSMVFSPHQGVPCKSRVSLILLVSVEFLVELLSILTLVFDYYLLFYNTSGEKIC